MSKRSGLLGGLFLLTSSLVLMALAGELVARLTLGRPAPPPGRLPLGRYHPLLGWEKTPLAEAHIRRSEYDVHIEINAHGLRGPDRDYAKPEGTRRVLILGDSFGEGYYVEEGESVRALLEQGLKTTWPKTEVLNGSTAGYSTDQEYLFFTSEGVRYQPDVVLLFVFSNDLPDNLSRIGNAGRPKPLFVLHENELVLTNTPVPRPPKQDPESGALKPWRHSMALAWLSQRTEANPRLHAPLARIGLVPPLSPDPPHDLWPFRMDRKREGNEMWTRFSALLSALKVAVESSRGHFSVVYVPIRFEVEEGAWEATLLRYPPPRAWGRDLVADQLRATCERAGVPLVDPREALRHSKARAYFPRDGHWNALGNRIVEEVLEPAVAGALGPP